MRLALVFALFCGLVCHAAQAEPHYEFSFGTSQMFIDQLDRAELKGQSKVVLPTTSALFLGERLWSPRWSTIAAFNLPLVTQKFLVGGELVEEVAAKTFAVGQAWRPVSIAVGDRSVFTLQLAALASALFSSDIYITPSIGTRLHLVSDTGFTMYFGGLASYGLRGGVLLYGVGHRF